MIEKERERENDIKDRGRCETIRRGGKKRSLRTE